MSYFKTLLSIVCFWGMSGVALLAQTGNNENISSNDSTSEASIEPIFDSITVSNLPVIITNKEDLPANAFYQNEWANSYTRLSYKLNKAEDYTLPLQIEGENAFVFPCKGEVCSNYGIRNGNVHSGMDVKLNHGDSIVAAWDGVVRMVKKGYYGYGNLIVLRHENGLETVYSHLSALNVQENQKVKAGELIGLAGRTGRATTDHLHFETRFLYEHFDPRIIIDFKAKKLISDTVIVKNGKFYCSKNLPTQTKEAKNIIENNTDTINQTDTAALSTPIAIVEKPAAPKEIKKPQPKPEYHTIKKGDTLYQIARKYRTTVKILCEINKIDENSILSLGQKIKLP